MSKEIEILNDYPVIFTKDVDWHIAQQGKVPLNKGDVVLLPEDAVLVIPPQTINVAELQGEVR